MKELFEEYGSTFVASICGISIITIFLGVLFGNSNSLKLILETWLHQLI